MVVPPPLPLGLVCPSTLLGAAVMGSVPELSSAVLGAAVLDSMPDVVSTVFTPAGADNPLTSAVEYLKEIAENGMPARSAVFGPPLRALRDSFNGALLEVRLIALYLTLATTVSAFILGIVLGDRSRPDLPMQNEDDGLYRTMPRGMAAIYDRGGMSFDYATRVGLARQAPAETQRESPDGTKFVEDLRPDSYVPVSVGLWIELVCCVILDALGAASYFYPQLGEVVDGGFAFIYAFSIELFFDWPAMALFGFWEELLPYTDFIPTATLAWILTVVGVRYSITDRGRKAAGARARRQRRGVQGPLLIDRLVKNTGELPREKRPARWFDDQWGYLDDDSEYLDDYFSKNTRTGPNMRDQSGNALP